MAANSFKQMSKNGVIKRTDKVVSQFLLHHSRKHYTINTGDQITEGTITRAFMEARIKAGVDAPEGSTPPSFHEQRSLSSRLYKKQGVDVKTLLGHSTEAMSEQYRDDRGLDWKKVVL